MVRNYSFRTMRTALLLLASLTMPAAAQQKLQASDLIALANSGKPGFSEAIASTFAAKTLQDWDGMG